MKLGEHFIQVLGGLDSVPSIQYLWKEAQQYVKKKRRKDDKKIPKLNFSSSQFICFARDKNGREC